jgi:endonuclease/exonuclease/phosphatase family metal-dependent hydrolase
MESVEFPVEETGRHRYGLAVLSRYRFAERGFLRLPNLYSWLKPRKRSAILATLESTWGPIRLINTHLSVFKMERRRQLAALLAHCPVAAASGDPPLILCGDLNAGPFPHTYRTLVQQMTDTRQTSRAPEPQQGTFHARSPAFRIDHIFVSLHFTPLQSEVVTTAETTVASDHLPLFADVALEVNRSGRRT